MNSPLAKLMIPIACITGLCHADNPIPNAGDDPLYLHCFRPTYGQSVVADPKAARDENPATPPALLVTLKLQPNTDFEVIVDDKMYHISGRISKTDASYKANLSGAFGSGAEFSGAINLEEIFDPETTWISGAEFPFRCVVSKHKDVSPFLKTQAKIDAAKLQAATELKKRNLERRKNRKAEQDGGDKRE